MNNSKDVGVSRILVLAKRDIAILTALLSATVPGCREGPLRPAPGSNVILVCVDSLRPDHLGCYGYPLPTSPYLDRLAESGVRFTSASANATWTLPSIATLFTSLYPSAHGMHSYSMDLQRARPLPAGVLTLAHFLRNNGYRTAAFSDGGWVSRDFGLDRGFDYWEEGTFGIKALVEKSLAWADSHPDRPFLYYLHAHTVHYPYRPPLPYRSGFGIDEDNYLGRDYPWERLQERAGRGEIAPGELARIVRQYDAGIAYADEEIGRLLEGLRVRGLQGSTLVIIFADHGEQFLEHGQIFHGQLNNQTGPNRQSCYEETIKIPLIMAGPGAAAGRIAEGEIALIDIFPTLADYLSLPLPEGVCQGRSFLSGERGEVLFIEDNLNGMAALRSPRWKLILDRREGRTELYDLESDPAEKTDLSHAHPERVEEMMAVIAEKDRINAARGAFFRQTGDPAVLSPRVREQLKSLGYLP